MEDAPEGAVFVLHACGHNPTGCDPTWAQWQALAEVMKRRNLFPLFDAAYLGINSGDFDTDARAIRYFVDQMNMNVVICLSFAKNMGLYGIHPCFRYSKLTLQIISSSALLLYVIRRKQQSLIGPTAERVGCVAIICPTKTAATNTTSVLAQLQRAEVSNPPAYGARIAATILGDIELCEAWKADLKTMSTRIASMRQRLLSELKRLGRFHSVKRDMKHAYGGIYN